VENGLDSLFGCLLGRKTGPIVKAPLKVVSGVSQIALSLIHPVCASFHGQTYQIPTSQSMRYENQT